MGSMLLYALFGQTLERQIPHLVAHVQFQANRISSISRAPSDDVGIKKKVHSFAKPEHDFSCVLFPIKGAGRPA